MRYRANILVLVLLAAFPIVRAHATTDDYNDVGSATTSGDLSRRSFVAQQESRPVADDRKPNVESNPSSPKVGVQQSSTQETTPPASGQPQTHRSRIKRNAKASVASELPAPLVSPTISVSVWNGPAQTVASGSNVRAGKSIESTGSSFTQRAMTWSGSHWRWFAGIALAALAVTGFVFLRRRAKREAQLKPKYPRWSDRKIGPTYEPRTYAPKPGQRRSIVDVIDLLELSTEETEDAEQPPAPFVSEVEEAKNFSATSETPVEETGEPEVEPAIVEREIEKLLAAEDFDAEVISAGNARTRKAVETALLSVLSGREFAQHDRAQKALFDFNYFDDLTSQLRTADTESERETAARLLGLVRDPRASAHLVVSLRDPSVGVRRAAVESIGQIGDPAAVASLRELLKRESGRELPEAVIKHAIKSITVTQAKRGATSADQASELSTSEALLSDETPVSIPVELHARNDSAVTASAPDSSLQSVHEEDSLQTAQSLVSEAEKKRLIEEDDLQRAEMELQKATEELAQRRIIVEEARLKAEEETETLKAIADQIRADEASRRQIEIDLQNLKVEAQTRLEEERLKFEAARRSVVEEQQRLAEELTKLFSEENERLSSLELEKQRAEVEVSQRSELEKRLKAEIEELYAAGAEQRARVEVQTQRRAELESSLTSQHVHEGVADNSSTVENHPPQLSEDIFAEDAKQAANLPAELIERLRSGSPEDRAHALHELSELGGEMAFAHITEAFADNEITVRNAAAIALHNLEGDPTATFTRALKESDPEKRRVIGAAIASSGLAQDSIPKLTAESREDTYNAFSLLFLMARAGELQPLLDAVSNSSDVGVQLAVVKLLNLTHQPAIVPALESLTIHHSLSPEVKSALNNAIDELGGHTERTVSSVA